MTEESDPFDDPLWKEADARAQGYVRPRPGYIGFPQAWLEQVLPLVKTGQQLAVALVIYRHLRWDKPVPVPNSEIGALGIDRRVKYRTLMRT